jgi:hypothetical protein
MILGLIVQLARAVVPFNVPRDVILGVRGSLKECVAYGRSKNKKNVTTLR